MEQVGGSSSVQPADQSAIAFSDAGKKSKRWKKSVKMSKIWWNSHIFSKKIQILMSFYFSKNHQNLNFMNLQKNSKN